MKLRWVEIDDQDEIQITPCARRFEWDGDHYYKLQVWDEVRGKFVDVNIEFGP